MVDYNPNTVDPLVTKQLWCTHVGEFVPFEEWNNAHPNHKGDGDYGLSLDAILSRIRKKKFTGKSS